MILIDYRCDRLLRLYCFLQLRRGGRWYRVAWSVVKVLLREGVAREVE